VWYSESLWLIHIPDRIHTVTQQTLEDRVAALERQVADLTRNSTSAAQKDWRRTIGMFTGDEVMKQIIDEGKKVREADRRKTRGSKPRSNRKKK
jgi:hypothetical protein